jgi:hypothetical protein
MHYAERLVVTRHRVFRTARARLARSAARWLQSTTLQTALMQAYISSRLAELTIGLGAALVTAGAGVTALARPQR